MKTHLWLLAIMLLASCVQKTPPKTPLAPAQPVAIGPDEAFTQLNLITSQEPPYRIKVVIKRDIEQKKLLLPESTQRAIDHFTGEWVKAKEEHLRKEATHFAADQVPRYSATVEFIMPPSPCPEIIPFALHIRGAHAGEPEETEEVWMNLNRESEQDLAWEDLWVPGADFGPAAVQAAEKNLRKEYDLETSLSPEKLVQTIRNSRQFLLSEDLWVLVDANSLHSSFPDGQQIIIPIPYRYLEQELKLSCD